MSLKVGGHINKNVGMWAFPALLTFLQPFRYLVELVFLAYIFLHPVQYITCRIQSGRLSYNSFCRDHFIKKRIHVGI